MKKYLFILLMPFFLFGCKSAFNDHVTRTYSGELPCADCEGIKTELILYKDNTAKLTEIYLQDVPSTPFIQKGHWIKDSDRIILVTEDNERYYYQQLPDQLKVLDKEGNEIISSLNYSLMQK